MAGRRPTEERAILSLSQTTGYAIRALTYLAQGACTPSFIEQIAESTGVPRSYLAKILRKLNDAGIVASKRGYKGGIWLARPPEEISLLHISMAMGGEDLMHGCLLGFDRCSDDRNCPTHQFWKKSRAEISSELARISLADVVKFNLAHNGAAVGRPTEGHADPVD